MAVIVIGVAWLEYKNSLTFAAIFWSTIAVLFGVAFFLAKKPRKTDPVAKQNLADLQNKGIALHYEQETSLSSTDLAALSKTMRQSMAVLPICAIVGFVIVYFFIDGGPFAYAIAAAVLILIAVSLASVLKAYRRIVSRGVKTVIRGVVTNRLETTADSGDNKKTTYYVIIGDRQLRVDQEFYNEYLPGDALEVHFAETNGIIPYIFQVTRIPIENQATN
ncbi:hypothetical protein WBG78_04330 [Chryseolinea sp. T2]|uniref:hypothetical protein n=1 Tax=Chryseolinea sp. T2 TaxID=3129255 RepID=UPI0030774197